jgi:hypothetical protein
VEDIQAVDREFDSDLEQSLLTTWNAQVVDYDHDKYPFADWVLGRIRKRSTRFPSNSARTPTFRNSGAC